MGGDGYNLHTTGTTGEPKAVAYSHRQLVLHTMGLLAGLGPMETSNRLHNGDVYMPITPMFHVHAWGFPYAATLLGIKQVYAGRYTPANLLRLITEEGVTFSHCVPTILKMLLSAPEVNDTDLSKLKILIGGSRADRTAEAALARGINVFQDVVYQNLSGINGSVLDPNNEGCGSRLKAGNRSPWSICKRSMQA